MALVTGRHVERVVTATVEYVQWFVATQTDEDIVKLLRDIRLRPRMSRDCPPALTDLHRGP
jgi:hypothetical protein